LGRHLGIPEIRQMLARRRVIGAKPLIVAAVLFFGSSSAFAQSCDRACLKGLLTQFVDALVAHDHTKLPLADTVKYTEDSRNARLGEGIWQSITADAGFRQDYIDVRKQVAATHVWLKEGDTNVLYSALLHVADGKIRGIETLVQRMAP